MGSRDQFRPRRDAAIVPPAAPAGRSRAHASRDQRDRHRRPDAGVLAASVRTPVGPLRARAIAADWRLHHRLWGLGFDIAERMGIVPLLLGRCYKMERLSMVDASGAEVAGLDIRPIREQLRGRFISRRGRTSPRRC